MTYNKKAVTKKTTEYKKIAKIARQVHNKEEPVREIRFALAKACSTTAIANGMHSVSIGNISQGDQRNQRSGNKIYMSGAKVSLHIENGDTSSRTVRCMILQARAVSNAPDVITYTNLYATSAYVAQGPSFVNYDTTLPVNRDVWKVICDKKFSIGPSSQVGSIVKDFWCPIKKTLRYQTIGSNTTDDRIYFIYEVIQDDNATNTAVSQISYMLQVYFKDA